MILINKLVLIKFSATSIFFSSIFLYLGNLYPNVRGGIPRAIGVIPFIILSF